MRRILVTLGIALTVSLNAMSQEQSDLFQKAVSEYKIGHFQQVEELLAGNVESIESENQVQAYRLLVLSCLYRDMPEAAEAYASKLLQLDPFYTSYGDSPRFADILTKLKKGSSTITSASKMPETVEEVPVPVTLITADMIRASGAVKLQDVLKLYVPGFSEISSLEENVAMRGVSGLGQETILIMLDGHRLNSQSTNSESFDFRNSLDKIKQIEVLRGPASSLYGNVALTAVVNIVTRSGSDMDGGRISAMGGANKAYGGSFTFGHGNLQSDYMVWGSIYNSEGEKKVLSGTTHYIGAYNQKPTFDLGTRIHWGDVNLSVMGQHGHPVPYYNLLSIGETFSYDDYGTYNGEGPGMSRTNLRADLEWNHTWNDLSLSASIYAANERMQIYNVIGDTIPYMVMAYLAQALGIKDVKTRGIRQAISWDDYSFGGTVSGLYNYSLGQQMSGSLLVGLQFEDFIADDGILMIGADYNNTNNVRHSIILDGIERTLSSFVQVKHYFTKELIFNGGLRYDFKHRLDGRTINTLSPRVSLIWMPNQMFTVKGAYSHAFVDAAAFYRASTISLFSGGTNLNPEIMDSYQLDAIINWRDLGLRYEFNTFYNVVKDMVYFNTSIAGSTTETTPTTFTNAGRIAMGGIENVLQYTSDRIVANLNATFQYPFDIKQYSSSGHNVLNVPRFMGNAVAQYAVLAPQSGDRLWIRANMHAQSSFDCQTNDLTMIFVGGQSESYKQDGYVLLGAGAEYKWNKGISVSFDVYNLTNKYYEIGGQLLKGVPGLGRSFMARIAYDF